MCEYVSVSWTSFSGELGYIVPRLNGQNYISAGDFDIFYLINGGGRTFYCNFLCETALEICQQAKTVFILTY